MYGLRILLADADVQERKNVKDLLVRAGHSLVAEAGDGRTASQLAFSRQPDLVILDHALPVRDGLEVARVLDEQRVAPVLLLLSGDYWGLLERARAAGVYGLLVKPVTETTLLPEVVMAWSAFQRVIRLEQDNRSLRESLENRKLVEKAKGLLMQKTGWSEQEAYQHLRKLAMDRCVSIDKIAKTFLKGGLP